MKQQKECDIPPATPPITSTLLWQNTLLLAGSFEMRALMLRVLRGDAVYRDHGVGE